jgi:hypothetical protein
MADRQHQQIGLAADAAVGGQPLPMNSAPVRAGEPAVRRWPYRLGETLADIAPKLAALGVERAVFTQRLRIVSKGRLTAVPAIEAPSSSPANCIRAAGTLIRWLGSAVE